MTILQVQRTPPSNAPVAGTFSTGTGSVAPSWGSATTVGNLLVAAITATRPTGGIVISAPVGWTAGPSISASANSISSIFYIEASASRSGVETFTQDRTTDMTGLLFEYSGLGTGVLDVTTSSNGTGTALSTGTTGTDSAASAFFLAVLANRNTDISGAPQWGGSATGAATWSGTSVTTTNANKALAIVTYVRDYICTVQGTGEMHSTLGTSRAWTGLIVCFQAAGVGVTGTGGITAAKAVLAGTGIQTANITGTGNLGATATSFAGVGAGTFTGTGNLGATAASFSGAGNAGSISVAFPGYSSYVDGYASATGQGGGFLGSPASLSGTGTLIFSGTGAFGAASAALAGAGTGTPLTYSGPVAFLGSAASFAGMGTATVMVTGTGGILGAPASLAGTTPPASGVCVITITKPNKADVVITSSHLATMTLSQPAQVNLEVA